MRWNCLDCGRPTIRARELDNKIVTIDAEPVPDGELTINGDLDDDPLALWNFTEEDAEFWRVPSNLPRHNKHRC